MNRRPSTIQFVETMPVDWPDGCLGLPGAGESSAQVISPSFGVSFEAGRMPYQFRTNGDGNLVRLNAE